MDPEPSSGNEPGALGISDAVVGLITGLDHDRIQVATYAEGESKVAALAIGPPRHGG